MRYAGVLADIAIDSHEALENRGVAAVVSPAREKLESIMKLPCLLSICCCLLLASCAAAVQRTDSGVVPDADRRAILSMLGEYEVRFEFSETVVLQPDYRRRQIKTTGGDETVVLVSDEGRRISLQHLLVAGGHVVKHWRQDWEYEAPRRLEFSEDQTWRLREIPAQKTRGAWTQCVYEVSDAPRYCGTGRWEHSGGVATWTSDASWRPLPRREYTVRKDYNAVAAINRHSVVPGGWTHEQDNSKVVRDGEQVQKELVREFGFNDYRRTTRIDFKPAYDYWKATAPYWARVRAEWDARFAAGHGVRLNTAIDGMALIEPLFGQADEIGEGRTVSDTQIRAVFDRFVAPAP